MRSRDRIWVIMLMLYLIIVLPILLGFSLASVASLVVVPCAVVAIAGNIVNWNLHLQFPKAWSENSLHLSLKGYHVMLVVSIMTSLAKTYFSMSSTSGGTYHGY